MRNKYGKLLIKCYDDSGTWKVKDEYVKPLIEYAHAKQYKDIILELGDGNFIIPLTQTFGASVYYLEYSLLVDDGTGKYLSLSVDLSDDTIEITLVDVE